MSFNGMSLLHGVPIQYVHRKKVSEDEWHQPIFGEEYETIDNVLVAPVSQMGIPEQEDLQKKKKQKMLGIPKGDNHDWKDCVVLIDGERYESVGFPEEGIEDLVPGPWHKKVKVQLYE